MSQRLLGFAGLASPGKLALSFVEWVGDYVGIGKVKEKGLKWRGGSLLFFAFATFLPFEGIL